MVDGINFVFLWSENVSWLHWVSHWLGGILLFWHVYKTVSVYFGTFTHHSNIDPILKCNHDFTIQVSFVNIVYVFSFYFYLQCKHWLKFCWFYFWDLDLGFFIHIFPIVQIFSIKWNFYHIFLCLLNIRLEQKYLILFTEKSVYAGWIFNHQPKPYFHWLKYS